MDRIETMTAFVTTMDASGFSAAGRKLDRSPASITRAVAFLEARLGSRLLRRTTRSIKLTEDGQRYLAACRRLLADLEEAEQVAAGEQAVPRGLLAVTAPVAFGSRHVRPAVDAFLETYSEVQVRLLLLDRLVNLVEEGIDAAVRIGHLPDSSLIAVRVGEVRRVVCASPGYLVRRPAPREPSELSAHECIAFSQETPNDLWAFAPASGKKPRYVKTHPRLMVNTADAAIGAALDGRGVTRVLSYQIEAELHGGRLIRLLPEHEPPPLPVHVVYPAASASSAKLRAFADIVVPRLRKRLSAELSTPRPRRATPRRSRG